MKKILSIICVCFLSLSLVACATHKNDPEANDESSKAHLQENITMLEDGIWPDNEYTEGLPVPNGSIEWVILDPEKEYCSINVDGMSQAEYDKYIEALIGLGFHEIESVSEEISGAGYVSVGTIYSDNKKSLSIAYADENFGIYIVREAD